MWQVRKGKKILKKQKDKEQTDERTFIYWKMNFSDNFRQLDMSSYRQVN